MQLFMTYCPMMEEQLLLIGSDVANVVRIRYSTLTGGDSAIIFVDSYDGIRSKVSASWLYFIALERSYELHNWIKS